MKLRERYRRLTFWNKIAFWGSLASLVGAIFLVVNLVTATRDTFSDPLAFTEIHDYVDSHIHIGASSDRSLEWIQTNTEGIPTTPFMSFTVTSSAPRYHVQIAPYLVIDVTEVKPIPENIAAVYQGERGGGAIIRQFKVALAPETGLVAAPHINDEGAHPDYDYYTLGPGESEIFTLYLSYESGYIYTYNIGVQYRYRDHDEVRWLPKTYKIGTPSEPVPVFGWQNLSTVETHPDHVPPRYVREWAQRTEQFMNQRRVFSLNQIQ